MTQALVIGLGIVIGISVLFGIAKLVYSLTDNGKNMARMHRLGWLVVAFVILGSSAACGGNDDTVTPTAMPEVITGEVTADALIEDTQDAVEDTASALCKACLVGELLGGDACNCNNICDAEVECKSVEQGE